MFCKKCGAQMEENAKFCPKCGAAQDTVQQPAATPLSTVQASKEIPLQQDGFKAKFFNFTGRLNRKPFIIRSLIVGLPLSFLIELAGELADGSLVVLIIATAIMFMLFISSISIGARRCHDLNHSGWFQIIPFYAFVMLFSKGTTGPNKYGPEPLA